MFALSIPKQRIYVIIKQDKIEKFTLKIYMKKQETSNNNNLYHCILSLNMLNYINIVIEILIINEKE